MGAFNQGKIINVTFISLKEYAHLVISFFTYYPLIVDFLRMQKIYTKYRY